MCPELSQGNLLTNMQLSRHSGGEHVDNSNLEALRCLEVMTVCATVIIALLR